MVPGRSQSSRGGREPDGIAVAQGLDPQPPLPQKRGDASEKTFERLRGDRFAPPVTLAVPGAAHPRRPAPRPRGNARRRRGRAGDLEAPRGGRRLRAKRPQGDPPPSRDAAGDENGEEESENESVPERVERIVQPEQIDGPGGPRIPRLLGRIRRRSGKSGGTSSWAIQPARLARKSAAITATAKRCDMKPSPDFCQRFAMLPPARPDEDRRPTVYPPFPAALKP